MAARPKTSTCVGMVVLAEAALTHRRWCPSTHPPSKLSQRPASAAHPSPRVNTPRQYVLRLPARMHVGRYTNGVSFPSVILSSSSPTAEKLKLCRGSAPSPPFKPFALCRQLSPQQTAQGCPKEPPVSCWPLRERKLVIVGIQFAQPTWAGQRGEGMRVGEEGGGGGGAVVGLPLRHVVVRLQGMGHLSDYWPNNNEQCYLNTSNYC